MKKTTDSKGEEVGEIKMFRSNSLESLELTNRNSTKSPKKSSKKLDNKSPTKKSQDFLSKLQSASDDEAITNKNSAESIQAGLKKFTKDISDVAGKKLPHIVSFIILVIFLA